MREPTKFKSEGRKRESWRGKRCREMIVTLCGLSSLPWSLWKSGVVTGELRQLSGHRGGPCRSAVCKLDLGMGTKPRDSSNVGTFGENRILRALGPYHDISSRLGNCRK